jgi:hypothetical protein
MVGSLTEDARQCVFTYLPSVAFANLVSLRITVRAEAYVCHTQAMFKNGKPVFDRGPSWSGERVEVVRSSWRHNRRVVAAITRVSTAKDSLQKPISTMASTLLDRQHEWSGARLEPQSQAEVSAPKQAGEFLMQYFQFMFPRFSDLIHSVYEK